jgi:hypothetical protein
MRKAWHLTCDLVRWRTRREDPSSSCREAVGTALIVKERSVLEPSARNRL